MHNGAHYCCSVLGAQKFARAGAMICRLWGSLARSQELLPLNFDLTMSGWQAKADLTNSADCWILDRKISHVLTFSKSQKVFKIGCVARQRKQQSSCEVLARGPAKPNWPGRDGQRGTDTAGAGGLLLHLGLLGLFCCFAVLHPGLLLNFGGVSLFCILF